MPKVKKNCVNCGEEFEVYPHAQYDKMCCSRECSLQRQRKAHPRANKNENPVITIKQKPLMKPCKGCKKEFLPESKTQVYCNVDCFNKHRAAKIIEKKCPVCGKVMRGKSYEIKTTTCSLKCAGLKRSMDNKNKQDKKSTIKRKRNPKVKKICANCKKEFEVWASVQERRKTCSKECNREWQKVAQAGEKNGNYRHGKAVRKPAEEKRIQNVRELLTKSCIACKEEFTTKDKKKVYCTLECYEKHRAAEMIEKACAACGKMMKFLSYEPRVVCSHKCGTTLWHIEKNHNMGTVERNCPNCKETFTVAATYKNAKYCSVKCRDEDRRVLKQCAWCGVDVIKPKSRGHYEYSFCSDDHRLNWLNGGIPSPSKPERATIEILDELGIKYEFQHPFGKYVFDFAILDLKIDLEIDGEYHHSLPHNAARDRRRDWWARENGWKVVRIPSLQVSKEVVREELRKVGYKFNDELEK